MSLAIDLTSNQVEIERAEREASALLRRVRAVLPPAAYNELQLKMCIIASEATRLKLNLGVMRMTGELEQRPPAVTAETLELAECMPLLLVGSPEDVRKVSEARVVPMLPKHALRDESAAFARELVKSGDGTLRDEEGAA